MITHRFVDFLPECAIIFSGFSCRTMGFMLQEETGKGQAGRCSLSDIN